MPVSQLNSSVGKKMVMAVTGFILVGFIVGHLLGNLLIFAGPDALNGYGKKLRDLGGLLWGARIVLITAVVLHIVAAIKLNGENRAARPEKYAVKKNETTTYAARTMMMSGLIVLAFLIYHLLHFTVRVTNPDISHHMDLKGRHDIYTMMVLSFQNVYISAAYIIAQLLLASHLSHGFQSMFQSLGFNDAVWLPRLRNASRFFAFLIFAGYILIPVAVLAGWVDTLPSIPNAAKGLS